VDLHAIIEAISTTTGAELEAVRKALERRRELLAPKHRP
jgi:hypothetical protein